MANCEVEKVLNRISKREAERERRKQARMSALKEKYRNLVASALARTVRTSQSNIVIFDARHEGIGKSRSLVSECFVEWSEAQRAESRTKAVNEILADPKI